MFKLKNKKGIMLIASYLVIVVLAILIGAFFSRSIIENWQSQRGKERIQAFYLAEAGIDRTMLWLDAQSSPPSGTNPFNPFVTAQSLGSGTYNVIIYPDANNPTSYTKRYKVISTATINQTNRALEEELATDHFARYAYFTNGEHFTYQGSKIPVWFTGGDIIRGPSQTNSHVHIKDDPTFEGNLKTTDIFVTFYNNGNYINDSTSPFSNSPRDVPDFQGGIQVGQDAVNLPSKALDLRTAANQGGLKLTGSTTAPTTITLNSDGTMNVTNSHQHWTNQNMPLPANGALFVDGGDVYLSGTLNGQLSIGTNRNVVVTNNITYADNPRTNPASNDILGIISEKDVVISQSAPYNLEVDASIMTLGNSWVAENWWEGPPKGTLTTYGGIIQKERGPVGTFSSQTGEKLSGWTKDYNYDPRLVNNPPPFYPRTGGYVVMSGSWKEQ